MDDPALTRRTWVRQCAATLFLAGLAHAASARPLVQAGGCTTAPRRRTIIWQPWSSHADMTDAVWRRMGQLARSEGYDRVLVQWSRYGNVDFWPAARGPHWMEAGMSHWRDTGLRLILGLYMGDDYYQMLHQPDERLQAHLNESLSRSVAAAHALQRHPPPLAVDAWYVPQEIDDLNWRSGSREAMLRTYLTGIRSALADRSSMNAPARPVYASAFFSGATPPEAFAAMLARLHRQTGVVWVVQGGLGTRRLSEERTAQYLNAISRTLPARGWEGILEVFDQRQVSGQAPSFEPAGDSDVARRRSVWCASTGRQPQMTFSLNQRVASIGEPR